MATKLHNQFSLGKVGDLLFARQTPLLEAETRPSIASRFAAWRQRRAAVAELSALSDRELADIGLTRQEIPTAVK
jgi:uncharacterized protein YjiS (DUF1127 family)